MLGSLAALLPMSSSASVYYALRADALANVEEAFLRCARAVLSKVDDGVIEPGQEGVQLGVGDGDGDGGGAGRRCSYC